jgi:putative lipoic acid-binding regulatory protein
MEGDEKKRQSVGEWHTDPDPPTLIFLSSSPINSFPSGEDPTTAAPRPSGGGAVVLSPDEAGWRALDEKVNEYPDNRVFKGIGTAAGTDRALFEADMVRAIEAVVGVKLPPTAVATRDSSGGKYVSVSVEVTVQSGEQVAAVFGAIKKGCGPRLKWLM